MVSLNSYSDMHIVVSCSAEYLKYSPVLFKSVEKNHPGFELWFHVFHCLPDDVIASHRMRLERACCFSEKVSILFHSVSETDIKDIDSSRGWHPSLWFRWKALDTLRGLTDRFLVLGIDTFVKKNISEFYHQDLEGFIFCASPDAWVSTSDLSDWPPRVELNNYKVSPSNYINCDVVLVNLLAIGAPSFSFYINSYLKINTLCLDQDVINYCFASSLKLAPSEFNYFPNIIADTQKDIFGYKNCSIVHFAGGPKPWNVCSIRSYFYVGHCDWWSCAHELGIRRRYFYLKAVVYRLVAKIRALSF